MNLQEGHEQGNEEGHEQGYGQENEQGHQQENGQDNGQEGEARSGGSFLCRDLSAVATKASETSHRLALAFGLQDGLWTTGGQSIHVESEKGLPLPLSPATTEPQRSATQGKEAAAILSQAFVAT